MPGVALASSAVTVVNALPTGIGSAIGIRRFVRATAHRVPDGEGQVEIDPAASRTSLAEAAARSALRNFTDRPDGIRLEVESQVPIGRGLKSSSAVATAIIRATARSFGAEPTAAEVAHLSADAGRRTGVSATGAFDDALAGLLPGVVLTDNQGDRLLLNAPIDPAWVAVVGLPPGTHASSPSLKESFVREAGAAGQAVQAARDSRWADAMAANTRLVERVMGYDYGPIRRRLESAGALAVAVTGLGPAFWALVPRERSAAVVRAIPRDVPERFVCEFTDGEEGDR
jgi:shikimate kinase